MGRNEALVVLPPPVGTVHKWAAYAYMLQVATADFRETTDTLHRRRVQKLIHQLCDITGEPVPDTVTGYEQGRK